MTETFERRQVLKGGLAVTAGTYLVAGCDMFSAAPSKNEGSGGRPEGAPKGKESPMLAERVKNGKLPPVEERLPEEPLVVQPHENIGVYGGTWRSAIIGPTDYSILEHTTGYEYLTRWDPMWKENIPNIATDFEVNEDATQVTFRLRKGLRWSDGEPFGPDDVIFNANDVLMNEEIFPGGPPFGEMEAEKVDDHTVRFTFVEPNAFFLLKQATPQGRNFVFPFHYLSRFHADYNPDIDELVAEEGAEDWTRLFQQKLSIWTNPELPTVDAWMVTTPLDEGQRLVVERNPYYWKVDPDGSQLPYVDRITFDVIQNAEAILLRAVNGDLDMHHWHFNTLQNKPVVAGGIEQGDYRFFETTPGPCNNMYIQLNLTHRDETLREVFRNKDFRIGLSHAMNRQEIIDIVYQRQGEPWQVAPRPESDFYNEGLAKQYTEHDVQKANEYLDRAGYQELDDSGIRLGPVGKPISFAISFPIGFARHSEWADVLELIKRHWREVGVDMRLDPVDRTLLVERSLANQHDAIVWEATSGMRDTEWGPQYYVPYVPGGVGKGWCVLWSDWYQSDGKKGEEPPMVAKEQLERWDRLQATADPQARMAIVADILGTAKEEFWVIGTTLPAKGYGIVKNNFHNVPDMIDSFGYPTPGPTNPEQYFFYEG